MDLDVCAYWALQRGRLAHARAVHLHPTQLSTEVVATIRSGGLDVHAWDVNDEESLAHVAEVGISKVCTDRPAFVARYLRDTLDREVPHYGIDQR